MNSPRHREKAPREVSDGFRSAVRRITVVALATFLWAPSVFSQQVDIVLLNGNILTMDDDDSVVSAVKIVDGRFVAVGDRVGEIDPSAHVIDLNGRMVTPGLMDSHLHYFRDSHVPGHIFSDIETTFTIAALLDALRERTTSVPAGEFITAFGRLRSVQFAENRLPTLAELDSAAPIHPVYLHVSFDGPAVTNTLGKAFFEARGVSVNERGTFNRGQAAPAVRALFADYTNDDALRTVREYMQFSASLGLTTIQNFSGCGGFGGQVSLVVLFLGEGDPGCDDACDSNDDGEVDISDPITTLEVLFLGQGSIPLPGSRDCGVDPTQDELSCKRSPKSCL